MNLIKHILFYACLSVTIFPSVVAMQENQGKKAAVAPHQESANSNDGNIELDERAIPLYWRHEIEKEVIFDLASSAAIGAGLGWFLKYNGYTGKLAALGTQARDFAYKSVIAFKNQPWQGIALESAAVIGAGYLAYTKIPGVKFRVKYYKKAYFDRYVANLKRNDQKTMMLTFLAASGLGVLALHQDWYGKTKAWWNKKADVAPAATAAA